MAKLKRKRKNPEMNMTSMMDIVFQLIIFFILVSNFSSADLPKLEPPEPDRSVADEMPEENMLIVNVLRNPAFPNNCEVRAAAGMTIPAASGPSYPKLTDLIVARLADNPEMKVNLRADRTLRYDQVEPVMKAITQASTTDQPLSRIHLVARTDRR